MAGLARKHCTHLFKSKSGRNFKKSLPNMAGLARKHCTSLSFILCLKFITKKFNAYQLIKNKDAKKSRQKINFSLLKNVKYLFNLGHKNVLKFIRFLNLF